MENDNLDKSISENNKSKKIETSVTTVRVPKDLRKAVLILCAQKEISMQSVINKALREFVEQG